MQPATKWTSESLRVIELTTSSNTLLHGDVVYIDTNGDVAKSITSTLYDRMAGVVVGGDVSYNDALNTEIDTGNTAAEVGDNVIVANAGIAYCIASSIFSAGTILSPSTTVAGRVQAQGIDEFAIGISLDESTGNGSVIRVLIQMDRGGGGSPFGLPAIYPVTQYGIVGDGVTDNIVAINALFDLVEANGGGLIYFPPGHYMVSTAIRPPSHINISGMGRGTVLENMNIGINTLLFEFGNYGPANSARTPLMSSTFYQVSSGSLQGNHDVTLVNAGDASNFEVGDIAFLYNIDPVKEGKNISEFQQINKVAAINGGIITFENPLYKDFDGTGIRISLDKNNGITVTPGGTKCRVVEQVTISNLYCIGNKTGGSDRWFNCEGAYKCLLEDIWVEESHTLAMWQMAAYCTARGIVGTFRNRAAQTAYFTHDCVIEDCIGTLGNAGNIGLNLVAIEHHENSHNCVFRNIQLDLGTASNFYAVMNIQESEFHTIEDITVVGAGNSDMQHYIRFFYTDDIPNVPKQGFVIRDVNICLSQFVGHQISVFESFGMVRKEVPNIIDGCEFITPTNAGRFIDINGGSDYEIRNTRTNRMDSSTGLQPANMGWRMNTITGISGNDTSRLRSPGGALNWPTPVVLVGDAFYEENTVDTLITSLPGGWPGKEIKIYGTSGFTRIQNGINIFFRDNRTRTINPGDVIRLVQFEQDIWREVVSTEIPSPSDIMVMPVIQASGDYTVRNEAMGRRVHYGSGSITGVVRIDEGFGQIGSIFEVSVDNDPNFEVSLTIIGGSSEALQIYENFRYSTVLAGGLVRLRSGQWIRIVRTDSSTWSGTILSQSPFGVLRKFRIVNGSTIISPSSPIDTGSVILPDPTLVAPTILQVSSVANFPDNSWFYLGSHPTLNMSLTSTIGDTFILMNGSSFNSGLDDILIPPGSWGQIIKRDSTNWLVFGNGITTNP